MTLSDWAKWSETVEVGVGGIPPSLCKKTSYGNIHYLLVRPEYQGRGIGERLIEKTKETYKDFLRLVLVAYDDVCGFYERCGFKKCGVKKHSL